VKDSTLIRVYAVFLLIFGVLAVVAFFAFRNISRSVATTDWVNHTHAFISELDGIHSSLHSGEAAIRSYVLTGDPRDMADVREAFSVLSEHMEASKALSRHDEETRKKVLSLETACAARSEFSDKLSAARTAGQKETVQALLSSDAGSGIVGDIRRAVLRIKEEQLALLTERDRISYLQAQTTRWIVGTGVAFNLILFVAVAWLIRDDLATRRRLAETLQEANEKLELKVKERTAELADSNRRLTTENLERRWTNHALEHQLRYNQLIVDCVHDLVFVLTKALTITRINPAVVHLTGFGQQDLLGKPVAEFLQVPGLAATDGPALQFLAQALKEGRDLGNRPAVLRHKDGTGSSARLKLFPLRDRDKVVGGVVVLQVPAPEAGPES
jgi:PAS domain S-box-containing protein